MMMTVNISTHVSVLRLSARGKNGGGMDYLHKGIVIENEFSFKIVK